MNTPQKTITRETVALENIMRTVCTVPNCESLEVVAMLGMCEDHLNQLPSFARDDMLANFVAMSQAVDKFIAIRMRAASLVQALADGKDYYEWADSYWGDDFGSKMRETRTHN